MKLEIRLNAIDAKFHHVPKKKSLRKEIVLINDRPKESKRNSKAWREGGGERPDLTLFDTCLHSILAGDSLSRSTYVHTALRDGSIIRDPSSHGTRKKQRSTGEGGQPGLNGGGEKLGIDVLRACTRKIPDSLMHANDPETLISFPSSREGEGAGRKGIGGEGIKICLRLTRGFRRRGKL